MDKATIEHAQRVCRQLVTLGLADKETARSHFKDYLLYLNLGYQGDFVQILRARKVIDERGAAALARAVPAAAPCPSPQASAGPAGPVGMTSMVLRLPGNTPPVVRPSERQPAVPAEAAPRTRDLRSEATLPLPDLEVPGQAERTLLEPHFEPPRAGPSRSLVEASQEDLLAFDFPATPVGRGRPPDRDGTVVLPESELPRRPGARTKGLAASTEGFADVLAPHQQTQGFHEVLTPDPRTSASDSNLPTQDYDSLKAHTEWAAASTPSLDSGSRAPDTGDQFWQGESGEEEESPFLEPKVGGYLGEFELLEVLGQGGMGVVFKVRHQGTNDLYALKVLRVRRGAQTETRRKRFRTEVQAMQRLRHENIVGVHGYGRDGPFDWYVMDYVEGKDLSTLLKAQALSSEQRLRVFAQVTRALVHAHKRGVIHRDLKPQNVLVDSELRVSILDFGLAKLLDDEDGMTHTGSALGTPFYMSPEQIADPRNVGPPADVFALGVMLYEMMTGRRPFTGHSAGEVGNKILTVDPPKPSRVNPEVHPNIDAICAKAMEKNPERRYASAEGLLKDLTLHQKGKSLRQESRLAGLRKWVERNRSGFVGGLAAAVVLLALIVLIAFVLWLTVD
ncbi:MAG: serine/threonine protein kinase [Planctomycetota bacterium]|nr:MAG: serine/threonine protein kinase [Planctomycetota bacterium]